METMQILDSQVFGTEFEWPDGHDHEFLTTFDDNGGDPDGNAWLPVEAVQADAWLISSGYAQMTDVMYATDEAIACQAGLMLADDWRDGDIDDIVAILQNWVKENSYGWSHYGAYGTIDSKWVFKPLVEVHP